MIVAMLLFTLNPVNAGQFNHIFDTFEFSISPPEGVSIKGIEWGSTSGSMAYVYLINDENFFVWNDRFYDWETRDTSDQNLADIWASDADSGEHSIPTITKSASNEYVVTGRMIRANTMITRATKIYDFDRDGLVDWKTTWNINGKYDYNTIERLAAYSAVIKRQPQWD